MTIDIIHELSAFDALREDWERVYAADRYATVFSSWSWLAGWLEASPNPWRVVVLRERHQPPSGFIALSSKVQQGRFGLRRKESVYLAGHPVTNHTGMVGLPDAEGELLEALARYFAQTGWTTLNFELTSDPRIPKLASRLRGERFEVTKAQDAQSPYLVLTSTFDDYLEAQFSGKARRELARRQRKAEARGLRLTQVASPEDLNHHLDAFLDVHQQRFGPVAPRHARMYRCLFTRTQEAGTLHFVTLWDGTRPVASQIGFLDLKHLVYHGCQGGWDAEYSDLAPGLLVKLEAIRYAAEHGFHKVDFGRGAHDYKFSLGGEAFHTLHVKVRRKSRAQRLKQRLTSSTRPLSAPKADV